MCIRDRAEAQRGAPGPEDAGQDDGAVRRDVGGGVERGAHDGAEQERRSESTGAESERAQAHALDRARGRHAKGLQTPLSARAQQL
eukprot:2706621-Rhodomonas_salina.1